MDTIFRKTKKQIEEILQSNKNIELLNNEINETIKKSLYNYLISINSKDLFNYLIISLVCLLFANLLNIQLTSIFGIVVGLLLVYIFYNKKTLEVSSYDNQLKIKLELIRPKPMMFDDYPEIIEFFYSIREFYNYNPEAFSKTVQNVDLILKLYKDIQIGIKDCKLNVDIVKEKKTNPLNHLRSIIYNLENNKILERKLKKALNALHKILNNYEKYVINICNKQIKDNGYDNSKSYIHSNGPKPYNPTINDRFFFTLY